MCRLLGIYGKIGFWQELVLEFQKQAEFGKVPPGDEADPGHKDGWGMARSGDDQTAMIEVKRELGAAYPSRSYQDAVQSITKPPHIFLCHLRKASANIPITLSNAHPFFSLGWAFIHNGTIYNAETLARDSSLALTSKESDSEYFFHYLLTQLFDSKENSDKLDILHKAFSSLNVEYTALNCLLSDGKDLYSVRSYNLREDYYTLYFYKLPQGVIVCSEPLESGRLDDDHWQMMGNHSLIKIHGDTPVFEIRTWTR